MHERHETRRFWKGLAATPWMLSAIVLNVSTIAIASIFHFTRGSATPAPMVDQASRAQSAQTPGPVTVRVQAGDAWVPLLTGIDIAPAAKDRDIYEACEFRFDTGEGRWVSSWELEQIPDLGFTGSLPCRAPLHLQAGQAFVIQRRICSASVIGRPGRWQIRAMMSTPNERSPTYSPWVDFEIRESKANQELVDAAWTTGRDLYWAFRTFYSEEVELCMGLVPVLGPPHASELAPLLFRSISDDLRNQMLWIDAYRRRVLATMNKGQEKARLLSEARASLQQVVAPKGSVLAAWVLIEALEIDAADPLVANETLLLTQQRVLSDAAAACLLPRRLRLLGTLRDRLRR